VSPAPLSSREPRPQCRIASRAGRPIGGPSKEEQQYAQPQYAQAPPPAPAAAPDTVSQLKELADLKAQGILTDAEFEAQKAKILAS
jgi:hypothetical protein